MLVTYLLTLTGIAILAFLMGFKIGKKYKTLKRDKYQTGIPIDTEKKTVDQNKEF